LLQSALKISDRALSRLRFQLPCSEQCIEACAKLAWVGESGKKAGAQFLELSEDALAGIKEWIANGGFSASVSMTSLASSPTRRPAEPTCSTMPSVSIPGPQPISRAAFPGSGPIRSGMRRLFGWLSEPICSTTSSLSIPGPQPISRTVFPGSGSIHSGMRRLLDRIAGSFTVSSMNRIKKSGSLVWSACVKGFAWGFSVMPILPWVRRSMTGTRSVNAKPLISKGYGRALERQTSVSYLRTYVEGEERSETSVTREDASSIREFVGLSPAIGEASETVKESIYRDVYLNPTRGSFDGEAEDWLFRRGDEMIAATIRDKEFLRKCMAGEYRLNHTDLLTVELLQRQRVVGTRVMKPSYEITKVTSYVRGPQQQKLGLIA